MSDRMKELDSVRGIAVLAVLAYHLFKRAEYFTQNPILHWITNLTSIGWIGVDIFFTLSGFLITTILLRTREHPHYFKNFYARRILRIVPIYLVLILLTITVLPKPGAKFLANLSQALPILLTFQQNWAAIFWNVRITDYLWVTWSLAVEEQFYFIWPLIVHRLRNETLLKAGGVYIFLSILARILGLMFFQTVGNTSIYFFFYYNSFTRFEELLIGALLAILLTYPELQEKIRAYSIPVFLIFLALFLAIVISSPYPPHPAFGYAPITIGVYTCVALFTAGLIAAFATYTEAALIRRAFQNPALMFFGKYSYSMYLFHVPTAIIILDWLWKTNMRGWQMYFAYLAIGFAVTTAAALLAWNLVEKHALGLKRYFEYE